MENSIFAKSYWKNAAGELKKLRILTFAALTCALSIVIGALYLVVGDNLRVYFTFLVATVGCAVYGPVVGIIAAAVTDTLSFFMFPSGPYFPGYMLGEMVTAVLYSLFLYRKKITVLRLYLARMSVNYLVNVLLGCLWSKILYGQGYMYYLVKSVIKNTLLLPFEVIVLAALFSVLIPTFARFGLLPAHEEKHLKRLKISASIFPVFGLSFLLGGACSFYYSTTQNSGILGFQILAAVCIIIGIFLIVAGPILSRKRKMKEAE